LFEPREQTRELDSAVVHAVKVVYVVGLETVEGRMAGTHSAQVREKTAGQRAVERTHRGTGSDSPTITVIYNGKVVAPRKMLGKEKVSFQGFTVSAAANHPNDITLELTSSQPAVDERAFRLDARSRALLRGKDMALNDVKAAGGAFTLDEVCQLMGRVSRQVIERRVREGRLLAVPGPSNRRVYPAIQFRADGQVLPGIKDVLQALPTENPWAILNFLVNPDSHLDHRKPIDLLKAGQTELVVQAAANLASQGA
jgi:hypothetical protein